LPATACSSAWDALRPRSCSETSWRWTSPATSSPTNPPAPASPVYSPWATCAPRHCGRWSPPYLTVQWLSTTRRNIWRRVGKGSGQGRHALSMLLQSPCYIVLCKLYKEKRVTMPILCYILTLTNIDLNPKS